MNELKDRTVVTIHIYVVEIPKGEKHLNGARNISGNIEQKISKFYQQWATHMC